MQTRAQEYSDGGGAMGAMICELDWSQTKLGPVDSWPSILKTMLGGFEVLQRLRADERTRGLPVVILSSSEQESDEHDAYRLGANAYIKKPRGFKESGEVIARIERDWLKTEAAPE